MSDLQIKLHPKQLEVFQSNARFKVVAAGRRFGKTRLAAWVLILKALESEMDDVFYVAPTFQQAKDILWGMLKELARPVTTGVHENTGVLTLINGRKIYLKGSDRPDTMRGVGLAAVVIDEYADMKPNVWEQILRPALAISKGMALFIGTPKGRNHFYDLFIHASDPENEEWQAWHFTSLDNPFMDPKEIEAARLSMSSFSFRQEFMASFEAAGSEILREQWLKFEDGEAPKDGEWYMSVDLAGFESVGTAPSARKKRLDETAISVVCVNHTGWWVEEIAHGRWDIKKTAEQILRMADKYKPKIVGIEKGSLNNAVRPYLLDLGRAMNIFPYVQDVTHGNKRKNDRIIWALQGRFEHGQVLCKKGDWNDWFKDQYLNFPTPLVHDDGLDSLAYIDQIATTPNLASYDEPSEWQIMDTVAGY